MEINCFTFYIFYSRAYSKQDEIEEYLFDFAEKFELLSSIKFNSRVTSSDWNEASQKWTVVTQDGATHEANFVISGIGALHMPLKPNFKDQVMIIYRQSPIFSFVTKKIL